MENNIPDIPEIVDPTKQAQKNANTIIFGVIGFAVLVIGGVLFVMYSKKKA